MTKDEEDEDEFMADIKFFEACRNGDLPKVMLEINYVIKKINAIKTVKPIDANNIIINTFQYMWNNAMYFACKENRNRIIKYLMKKIPKNLSRVDVVNYCMWGGCEGGHVNIIKRAIKNGASDWNRGLDSSCRGGSLEITKLMINNGASNIDHGVRVACTNGNLEVINYLVKNCVGVSDLLLGECLSYVCHTNTSTTFSILKILVDECKCRGLYNFLNDGLHTNVTFCENDDVIHYLVSKGASNLGCLEVAQNFRSYNLYCAYIGINSSQDTKCVNIIQEYPPYVFLVGWYIMKKREYIRCPIKKLPVELVRLLSTF